MLSFERSKMSERLEPFLICIPRLSGVIDSTLYRLRRDSSSLEHGLNGRMVKRGDVIAWCGGVKLFAPVHGKLDLCNSPSEHFRGVDWKDYSYLTSSLTDGSAPTTRAPYDHLLARIHPVSGQSTAGYIAQTYTEVIAFFDRFDNKGRKILRSWVDTKEAIAEIESACMTEINALRRSFGRFEPLS
jgi:hypothetical protein